MALFSARNLLTLTLLAFAKKRKKKKKQGEISINRKTLFLPLEDTFKSIAGLVELTKLKNEKL